jgi:hypothetical protein
MADQNEGPISEGKIWLWPGSTEWAVDMQFLLVGGTGIEPVTSSV